MAFVDIQKTLYDWVSGETMYPVIWLNPNAPRPALPYIGLHFLSLVKMGGDYIGKVDNEGIRKICCDYYININISCYYSGSGANVAELDVLSDLRLSLRTQSVADFLNENYISLIKELSSILYLPAHIATGLEPRAMIDMQFGTAVYKEDEIYLIETVEGIGTIKTDNGAQISVPYIAQV